MYWTCSVSTCNRKRVGLYFCSVACWDVHLPEARHREAWAEEKRAPSRAEAARERDDDLSRSAADEPRRIVVGSPASAPASSASTASLSNEVLVVVSKLKAYVRASTGMNTSDGVIDVLSEHLRRLCDEAARNAGRDGRKTLMDRDFEPLVRGG